MTPGSSLPCWLFVTRPARAGGLLDRVATGRIGVETLRWCDGGAFGCDATWAGAGFTRRG